MARGLYIGFFQDDDYAPDSTWSVSAEHIMRVKGNVEIAILGGRDGLHLSPLDTKPDTNNAVEWARKARLDWEPGRYFHRHGVCNYHLITQADFKLQNQIYRVDAVNMAPFIVRREVALKLNGFDEAFAPFQANEVDFCLRAIKIGYDVAVYCSGMRHGIYKGGTRRSKAALLRSNRQAFRNWQRVYMRHGELISARTARRELKQAE
jgi:GT2 family glycosyltransferase